MAMLSLIDEIIMGFNENKITIGVFLDFSKAFDTVDHNILLNKLSKYGIRGRAQDILTDYLNNRKQYVSFNGVKSEILEVHSGVPQGSILGPLLFLLYINDISQVSEHVFPILFADDSSVFIKGNDAIEMANILNNELAKLFEWVNSNKLSLNIQKTNFMLFRPRKCKVCTIPVIRIDKSIIKQVRDMKFLGLILDENLSWEKHVTHIKKKISKGIGILAKAKKNIQVWTLLTLYCSFIYPYLIYANEIWGSCNISYLTSLHILQKRSVRIIASLSAGAHSAFANLGILNIFKIYTYKIGLFMFRITTDLGPNVLRSLFQINENVHNYNTRQSFKYHVPILKF
jgi:hypothetical protein